MYKILNLFVQALETEKIASVWQAFHSCLEVSKKNYISRQCTYIVFLMQKINKLMH
jgi:hypothetical protein